MRIPRFVPAATALLLAAVVALFGTGTAQAAGANYVAVGDSYSAGLGAGGYEHASGACKRSTKAYPELWAATHVPASFAFTACSGAKTGDVIHGQLKPVDASTSLISISIGGNDAGFGDVMTTCVLHSQSTCVARVNRARTFVKDTLPALLDTTYDAIRAKGPHARVVVLGYPRFYQVPGGCVLGLSDTSRRAVDAAADDIDGVIAKSAANHGFAFADVRDAFTGHELCSAAPWLHSVTLPLDDSYHPTASGQAKGYLATFGAEV